MRPSALAAPMDAPLVATAHSVAVVTKDMASHRIPVLRAMLTSFQKGETMVVSPVL